MLYITTRDNNDAHTSYKTLTQDVAADGGAYVPFQLPHYNSEEIGCLGEKTFGDIVSNMLNQFFSCKLTGWTVDSAIGRCCVKTVMLNQRVAIAETWHNPEHRYSYIESCLHRQIGKGNPICDVPTTWVRIAVRIAVLFGIYGELLADGKLTAGESFDVSIPVDDLNASTAVCYAAQMGLPISMILCSSNEGDIVWDLIQRGILNTSALADNKRLAYELFLYTSCGKDETASYLKACDQSVIYCVGEDTEPLSKRFFSSVIGQSRLNTVINSVYRTNKYLIDEHTAVAHAVLQDYRAKAGENRLTLIFAENDPMASAERIMDATGLSGDALTALVKR